MPTTPLPAPERVFGQVVRAFRAQVRDDGSEVTLRLDPPDLGHVRVRLVSEGGAVTAEFRAESSGVRSLIENNLPALRAALQEAGVAVQSVSVFTGSDVRDFNGFGGFSQQAPRREPAPERRRGDTPHEPERVSRILPTPGHGARAAGAVDYLA